MVGMSLSDMPLKGLHRDKEENSCLKPRGLSKRSSPKMLCVGSAKTVPSCRQEVQALAGAASIPERGDGENPLGWESQPGPASLLLAVSFLPNVRHFTRAVVGEARFFCRGIGILTHAG